MSGVLAASLLLGAGALTAPRVAAQSAAAPVTQPATPPGTELPRATTVDQITDNPGAYYGVAVAVVGDVEDVLGPRAFTIEDQDLLFDEELLVVSGQPFAAQPDGTIEADMLQSQTLMVSGTVHMFNEAAFEDRLGVTLDDGRVADWAGRPALIADHLLAWSPSISAPWRNDSTNAANGRGPATIESITSSPMVYDGRSVTVGGYVENVLGQHAFVLEDGDLLGAERVLVVTRQQAAGLPSPNVEGGLSTEGYVWVSGTVDQFDLAAFEQQLGLDLDDSRFAEWAGRPAIVAGSVIPVRWGTERHPPIAMTPDMGTLDPAAQGQPSPEAEVGDSQSTSAIDAILTDPESYVGQTTTLSGQILQIVGSRSFVLADPDAEGEQLLVVSALSLPATFAGGDGSRVPSAGQTVEATGTIWRFDLGAFEERIGIDLDDSLFEGWSGSPVMIASAVSPTEQ